MNFKLFNTITSVVNKISWALLLISRHYNYMTRSTGEDKAYTSPSEAF